MIVPARYDSDIPDVTKQLYADFVLGVDAISGFTKHTLLSSAGGSPIYGYSIGDPSKPCIVIDGSIHNPHEWKSAYGVKEFMRVISHPYLYTGEQNLITYLKDKYRFFFIPVVSPDTYINGTEVNVNGVWIDRNFDYNWEGTPPERRGPFPFSENESQNIRDVVLNENTAIYINNHTIGNYDDLILLRENKNIEVNTIVRRLLSFAEEVYSDFNRPWNTTTMSPRSSSYNWVGEQDGALSSNIISTVFEPGFVLTMNQLLSISVWGMVCFIANVDELFDRSKKKGNRFFSDISYLTGNT